MKFEEATKEERQGRKKPAPFHPASLLPINRGKSYKDYLKEAELRKKNKVEG